MLATLYQSCIGANFMAPKVGYPNPAIGAKFDGSSGRNSYWQVPPTHIIASGNSLKGALLTAGIQGSHFEEDAGEKIVIVGSDERSTRVLSRIE